MLVEEVGELVHALGTLKSCKFAPFSFVSFRGSVYGSIDVCFTGSLNIRCDH